MRGLPGIVLLAALVSAGALAAPPEQAKREIDGLIAALGGSGCQFQRNGKWYPAAQAQAADTRPASAPRRRRLAR